jgi:primary-amine oxidase
VTSHPLDPLEPAEFEVLADVLRRERGVVEGWRYTFVEAVEPSKAALEQFRTTGVRPPRLAHAVCLERSTNRVFRAQVDLGCPTLLSFAHVPGVQPTSPWTSGRRATRC